MIEAVGAEPENVTDGAEQTAPVQEEVIPKAEEAAKKKTGDEGELFNTSSMFTLSGSQPFEKKSMKVRENKGTDRLVDVEKQNTDELHDRLSGEKARREHEEEKKQHKGTKEYEKMEKAERADRNPIPGSNSLTENLAQGAGVPSDTLHVKPSEENLAADTESVKIQKLRRTRKIRTQ